MVSHFVSANGIMRKDIMRLNDILSQLFCCSTAQCEEETHNMLSAMIEVNDMICIWLFGVVCISVCQCFTHDV